MNIFRTLRQEKGLTQVELSKILSINQNTVSNWETNKSIPDYETIIKLANLYNVSLDFIFDRENDYGVKEFDDKSLNFNSYKLTKQQKALVDIFRELPLLCKEMLLNNAKDYKLLTKINDTIR